jgi:hypothetical protein
MPVRTPPPGIEEPDHDVALGSTLTNAVPAPSTATHGPPGAHETALRALVSIEVELQVGLGLVGSEVLSAAP